MTKSNMSLHCLHKTFCKSLDSDQVKKVFKTFCNSVASDQVKNVFKMFCLSLVNDQVNNNIFEMSTENHFW